MPVRTLNCRVENPKGVHCRVATRITQVVADHDASVQVKSVAGPADCSSILDILSLSLVHGSLVQLAARGPDAEKVLSALQSLLSNTEDP